MGSRTDLPSGTVTFLFTDVEGSTKLLHALGAEAYADALAEQRHQLREAFTRHGGVEVDTQGDAFFVAFPTAPGALAAAREATATLAGGPIRVRIGLHTGSPHLTAEGYVGADVHRAARIAAAGHGGQILVSAATAALLDAADGLRDLGFHRLKDLAAAERLYQADPDEHPPLKTISNTNLPHALDAFVGRQRELEAVLDRLRAGARLLTLTGPGGTGKTRLAIEAATELVPEYRDGVFWVPLSALRDPTLVIGEIGRTIGAKTPLAEAIGYREMLLLLDNLEQIVDAGPDLAGLLEACPNLTILVTSRELLRVRGEGEFAVPPLAESEAVDLFSERAGITDPRTAEVCRRLDNLPLAVELAAARARLLSPAQILERLPQRLDLFRGVRDADARQQTLRATIEWSHDLLTPDEQRLFATVGVFRGGWTLEAVERVADADLDALASLTDKSLAVRAHDRFWMLETIRTFAEERLNASDEADTIHRRHLDHVVEIAEHWYAERQASESRWFAVLEAENDNIRAALDWAHDHAPDAELRLIGAVAALWMLHSQGSEAQDRLRAALEHAPTRDRLRARALTHLGELGDDIGVLTEALELWRELGELAGEALTLEALGWAYDHHGEHLAAREAHEQSLEVYGRAGSPELHTLSARAGLCHVLVARSETAAAATVAAELLEIARRHEAAYMEELALHFLADCPLVDGDFPVAEDRYRRALAFARSAGLVGRATDEVLGIAMALAGLSDAVRAVRIAAAAHAKQRELGKEPDAWWRSTQDRLLGAARAALTDADREAAEDDGQAAGFDRVVDELLAADAVR